MAQWLGQFSGHTHATRVEDAEAALRHAVAAYRSAGAAEDRGRKAKSVRHLVERLLAARLKLLKARIAAMQPVTDSKPGECGIESLEARETQARVAGVGGILVEFGAGGMTE